MNALPAQPIAAAKGAQAPAAGKHAPKQEAAPAGDVFATLLEALSAAAPEEADLQLALPDIPVPEMPLPEAGESIELEALEAMPAAEPPLIALIIPQEVPAPVVPQPAAPPLATLQVPIPMPPAPSTPVEAGPLVVEQRPVETPKAEAARPHQPIPLQPPAMAPASNPPQAMAPLAAPAPSVPTPSREREPQPEPGSIARVAIPTPETPRPEPQRPAPPAPEAPPIAVAMTPMREAPPALAQLAAAAKPAEVAVRATETAPLPSPVFSFTPVAADNARPMLEATLQSTPAAPAFANELTAQVRVMLDGEVHSARLELNPPELGPIRIELSMQAGSADITFAAAHAVTREGITQALPQLREMFAQQGLQLADAGVSAGGGQPGAQQQQEQAARDDAAARFAARRHGEPSGGSTAVGTLQLASRFGPARGALDLYA